MESPLVHVATNVVELFFFVANKKTNGIEAGLFQMKIRKNYNNRWG